MITLSIFINITVIILAYAFCKIYYKKTLNDLGVFYFSSLRLHNIFHGSPFSESTNNFSNIYCNVILKGIVTILCNIIIYCFQLLWITYLYVIYLLFSLWVFNKRLQHYRALDTSQKDLLKPAIISSSVIPVSHLIFYLSLFVSAS